MAIRQKANEKTFYQVFLAYDDLIHTHRQGIHERTLALNALLKLANIYGCLHIT